VLAVAVYAPGRAVWRRAAGLIRRCQRQVNGMNILITFFGVVVLDTRRDPEPAPRIRVC